KNILYTTCATDIAKLSLNMSTIRAVWWIDAVADEGNSSLQSTAFHDLVVVVYISFIMDGNKIHTWDGTTSVENAMQIPTDMTIVSGIKHPNGRDLIVFASRGLNYSHQLRVEARVYVIDTNTLEFLSETNIDDQVEGVIDVG